jgi:hypothetical protein
MSSQGTRSYHATGRKAKRQAAPECLLRKACRLAAKIAGNPSFTLFTKPAKQPIKLDRA